MDPQYELGQRIAYHVCEGAIIEIELPQDAASASRASSRESALVGKSDDAVNLNASEKTALRYEQP